MTIKNLVMIREHKESDNSFIFSSWLRSNRDTPGVSNIKTSVYYDNYKVIVSDIIDSTDTETKVICNPDDIDHIYGFVVYSKTKNILHYVYIKHAYRKMGVCSYVLDGIFGDNKFTCTHCGINWSLFAARFKATYNPFLIHYLLRSYDGKK